MTDMVTLPRGVVERMERALQEWDARVRYQVLYELRAALAQAGQGEAVAYWHRRGHDDEQFIHAGAVNGFCPDCEPLYLAPPPAPAVPAPSEPNEAAITPATLAAAIGCKAATILSALQPADVTLNQPLTAEQVAALLATMAEGAR